MTKTFKLDQYNRSVGLLLRQVLKPHTRLLNLDESICLEGSQIYDYLVSSESHSIKAVGPKTIDFICKEFDIQPPDAWKIRIDKYREDRKDKDERKRKKERYITVKINKIDADKLHDYLVMAKRGMHELDKKNGIDNLLDKVIIPLEQKFDWKE